MSNQLVETRAMTLVDLPLARRLMDAGAVLESELAFTRDLDGPNSALLSSLLLPTRSLHTFVTRSDDQQVVGQFRLKPQGTHAQMIYLAPVPLSPVVEDTEWLHLLDAMAHEAGKRGAQALIAEVDESSPLFETLRSAGFAVYSRQEIWQRQPEPLAETLLVDLHEASDSDEPGIRALYGSIVPPLMQQICEFPGDGHGYVYRKNGRVEGYITLHEGRRGIYLVPYLHPDIYRETPAVLSAAIEQSGRAHRVPVYVRLRRYLSWLEEALRRLGMQPVAQQAVLVRHLAARVRQPALTQTLRKTLEVLPKQAIPTPRMTSPRPATDLLPTPLERSIQPKSPKQE